MTPNPALPLNSGEELFGSTRPEGYVELTPAERDRTRAEFVGRRRGTTEKPPTSHTTRARRHLERLGYVYSLTEFRDVFSDGVITHAGAKHDLLGMFDAIAFGVGSGVVGVQVCSEAHYDARKHLRKMCSLDVDKRTGRRRVDILRAWLGAGNRALILAFERRAKVGNQEWFPVERWVTLADIEDVERRRRK